ncbi:hypothetical protein K7B07_10585 [Niabella sp. 3A5MI-3]|nr:hypothetical protein [Niabella beijingensis]
MNTMNDKANKSFKITGDWSVQSKNLKTKFPQLTTDDLKYETGKETELVKRVSARLDKKPEEVMGIIAKGNLSKL